MYDAVTLLTAVKAVNPQDDWGLVFSTVLTGIVVVFLVLVLLIVFLELMGRFFSRSEKKKSPTEDKPAELPIITPGNARFEKASENITGNENDIIAVISAAVAAIGESEGKTYTVKNIRKREKTARTGWGAAGIRESMNRFPK